MFRQSHSLHKVIVHTLKVSPKVTRWTVTNWFLFWSEIRLMESLNYDGLFVDQKRKSFNTKILLRILQNTTCGSKFCKTMHKCKPLRKAGDNRVEVIVIKMMHKCKTFRKAVDNSEILRKQQTFPLPFRLAPTFYCQSLGRNILSLLVK